jgi:hypothetical protein
MTKYISGGFDLRLRIELVPDEPWFADQCLVPEIRNRISADGMVWPPPEAVSDFYFSNLISYPLGLLNDLDELLAALHERGVTTVNLTPVCLTISEANVVVLCQKGWAYHFENAPTGEKLLACGWRFLGFDIVQLDGGLCSGLKGCGYIEPSWSQLRARFGGALNEVGLFSDDTIASQFAKVQALEIPEHAPFEVVGILVHDPLKE